MKRRIFFSLVVLLSLAGSVFAVKTRNVEIGNKSGYDGRVRIYRDTGGNMVFIDDMLSSPVTLYTLSRGVEEHSKLFGLGNDDHPQYLNEARHDTEHSSSYNDNLSVSPDVSGHTRLGDHLQDTDIHIHRSGAEFITGGWKFDVIQEFRDNLKFTQHGETGKMDLVYEDGEEDARFRWNGDEGRFEFNRPIYSEDALVDAVQSDVVMVPGTLYGNAPKSPSTGAIENFVSIEGIESENLLDKSEDEDVSGKWDFLNDVYIDGELVVNGYLNTQGKMKGLGKGQVVVVAKDGGDYETIQEAVDSITDSSSVKPYIIMVFPGIYNERVTLNEAYVSIVGVSPSLKDRMVVIEDARVVTGSMGYTDGIVNVTASHTSIANLIIRNTGSGSGSNTTPAVICSSGEVSITNVYIGGNGGRDIFSILNTADVTCRNVQVEQYNTGSNASHLIWVCNSSSLTFEYGKIIVKGTGSGPNLATTGDCRFRYTYFDTGSYVVDCSGCDELEFDHCGMISSDFFQGGSGTFNTLKTEMSNYGDVDINGDMDISGDTVIWGGITVSQSSLFGNLECAELKIDEISVINSSREITATKAMIDSIVINDNDIDGGGTVDITDDLNVTGSVTCGDASTDDFEVKDDDPEFTNLQLKSVCNCVVVDTSTGEIGYRPYAGLEAECSGACPVVFFRIDGRDWKCMGEIIKNANGNIFDGISFLGEARNHISIRISNMKEETDYLDYVALVREEKPGPGIVKFDEIPLPNRVIRGKDNVYRILEKGESLEIEIDVKGRIWLKAAGFYTKPEDEMKWQKYSRYLNENLSDKQ